MNWQNVLRILGSDYLKLVPIMALAFYIAFIPHQNYPYPVHLDEWVHLTYSQSLLEAGSITFTEPFLGQSTMGLSSNLAAGFHIFWGVFHQISGISWLAIFRYFPGIIFAITALSAYVLARREGFGLEAALLTCLIPTTVGLLGPDFLVPVAMGLLFIPLSLFIVFNFRTWWSYVVLFIFTCLLLSVHATTAVGLVIILIPYILLNLRGNFKHSLGITFATAIPFLALFPWIFDMLLPTAKLLLSPQPLHPYIQLPRVIQLYGYLPILLGLTGTFLLAMRGDKKSYGLIFGLLALLVMLVSFFTFHYGISPVYYRGLLYTMLVVSIVAGAGLMGLRNLKLPSKLTSGSKSAFLAENLGNILCVAIIGLTLAIAIPARQNTPYYHMIDSEDYQAFTWIKENFGSEYEKAILDPWKATAFSAITGKNVYTRIHVAPKPSDNEAYAFLRGGTHNTTFLKENGISIIYTRVYEGPLRGNVEYNSDNPNLVEVAKNIYSLKEDEKDR